MSKQRLFLYISIVVDNIYNLVFSKIKLNALIKILKICLFANKKLLLIQQAYSLCNYKNLKVCS